MRGFWTMLLILALAGCTLSASAEVSTRRMEDYTPPLRELAEEAGFKIGLCLSPGQLQDKAYLELLSGRTPCWISRPAGKARTGCPG